MVFPHNLIRTITYRNYPPPPRLTYCSPIPCPHPPNILIMRSRTLTTPCQFSPMEYIFSPGNLPCDHSLCPPWLFGNKLSSIIPNLSSCLSRNSSPLGRLMTILISNHLTIPDTSHFTSFVREMMVRVWATSWIRDYLSSTRILVNLGFPFSSGLRPCFVPSLYAT